MATGVTGSERMYPNDKNATNKSGWHAANGRTYPSKGRASPAKDADVKKCTVSDGSMPPATAKRY